MNKSLPVYAQAEVSRFKLEELLLKFSLWEKRRLYISMGLSIIQANCHNHKALSQHPSETASARLDRLKDGIERPVDHIS
jgi:hypothetical protein